MPKNLHYTQANNVERRTWNLEHYERKAKGRAAEKAERGDKKKIRLGGQDSSVDGICQPFNDDDNRTTSSGSHPNNDDTHEEFVPADSDRAGPESSQRAFLKARSRRLVDKLDSKVGSTEFVTEAAVSKKSNVESSSSGGVGWHCKVCDCYLKDSLTYLDHINGKKHQRYLGYSMRAERSTLDDVKETIKQLAGVKQKDKVDEKAAKANVFVKIDTIVDNRGGTEDKSIDLRMRMPDERNKRDSEDEESDDGMDPEIRAMMGFSSFAKGKK